MKLISPILVLATILPKLSMSRPNPRRVESLTLDINVIPTGDDNAEQYCVTRHQASDLFKQDNDDGEPVHSVAHGTAPFC